MPKRMKHERSGARKRELAATRGTLGDFGELPPQEIPAEAVTSPPSPLASRDLALGGEHLVRGNSNRQPLTPEGQATVAQTGQELAQAGGVDKIISSSAERATGTAAALQAQDPNSPPISEDPNLESHALGQLEGEPKTPEVKRFLAELIRKRPNLRIPGQGALSSRPGESFNEYRQRALSAVRGIMQELAENPTERIAVPTHSQIIKLVRAWVANGHPDDLSVSPDVFLKQSPDKPGSIERFAPDASGNWHIEPFTPTAGKFPAGSIYFVEHGQTDSTTHDRVSAGQAARAQIIKYVRSMDFGRARAVAQKAVSSGQLSDQDVEEALDESLPSDSELQNLPPNRILDIASAASSERRKQLRPLLDQTFGDLSGLPPDAQSALSEHLRKLS